MHFQTKQILFVMCALLTLFFCIPCRAQAEQCDTVLILDAGHGGEDGGAVSADGTPESGINLAITRQLADLMIFMGRDVILTRMAVSSSFAVLDTYISNLVK